MTTDMEKGLGVQSHESMTDSSSGSKFNDREQLSFIRECFFVCTMCVSQLITQASFGQVPMLPLPTEFGTQDNLGAIAWTAVSMPLSIGSFILISGRLGDMFGYKQMFMAGYVVISLASLLVGMSGYIKSNAYFNAMRGLEGVGFSLTLANALALLGNYFPDGSTKKTVAMCLFGSVTVIGAILGMVFGSLLSERWWPWAFWIVSLISAGMVIASHFTLPAMKCRQKMSSTIQFDYYGAITSVPAIVLIGVAMMQGAAVDWGKPYVYTLLIVGFIFLAAFLAAERFSKHPLIDPCVLNLDTAFVLSMIACGWGSFGVWLFSTARFSMLVDGNGPVVTATEFVPALVLGLFTGAFGAYMRTKVSTLYVMLLSLVGFFVTALLMVTRPAHQIFWGQKFVSVLLSPIGPDLSLPAATLLVSSLASSENQGMAASLVNACIFVAIALGISIAATIEVYTTRNESGGTQPAEYHIRNQLRASSGLAGGGLALGIIYWWYKCYRSKR